VSTEMHSTKPASGERPTPAEREQRKLSVLWLASFPAILGAMLMLLSSGPSKREEWEPSAALRSMLERMPLQPTEEQREHLAMLRAPLEEAIRTLEHLKQQRRLSGTERIQEEALRVLVANIKEVRRQIE
jgi:hypothetical protein